MKLIFIVLLGLALLPAPVQGQAAPSAPAHGNSVTNCAQPFVIVQSLGVISAGTVMFCADAAYQTATTTSGLEATATLTTPQLLGAVGTNTITFTLATSGCTAATPTIIGTSVNSVFGTQMSAATFVTMSSDSCILLWRGKVTAGVGPTTVYDQFVQTYTFSNPTSRVDNQNRLCGPSNTGTTCNNAQIIECNSTDIGATTCKDAHVEILDFQCAATGGNANALTQTTTCSTPTFNVVNSGSQTFTLSGTLHTIIDSWPSLTAAVTNSGTINVINSGGQAFTVSGSLSLSGGLTVTNQGGQSIVVTSWPQLQSVITSWPELFTDDLTRLCNASAHSTPCVKPVVDTGFTGKLNLSGSLANINATVSNPFTANFLTTNVVPLLLLFFFQVLGETVGKKRQDASYLLLACAMSFAFGFFLPVGAATRIVLIVNGIYLLHVMRRRYEERQAQTKKGADS